jgi:dihydroorotate dehydrogenase
MGFNNNGVIQARKKLQKREPRLIIGGNIGKNTVTPNENAVEDYVRCFTELYHYVDYFVVNISCPNISNLRDLQDKDNLRAILTALIQLRSKQKVRKPILIKVSPDLNDQQLLDTIDLAKEVGLDGFVATNTTTSRENLITSLEKVKNIGNGGLSGKPINKRSTEVIRFIAEKTEGQMPIIGVGGIMSPEDAIEKLNAGASLIQLYTGFIYQGPGLAKKICKAIVEEKSKTL